MTNIAELESCIRSTQAAVKSAEANLEMLRGELKALKQQQPEPASLLGRWATHPEHGRGIIVSSEPNDDGYVRIACRNDNLRDGAEIHYEHPEHLTLDPATLNTAQEFENAPEGTIVEATMYPEDMAVKTEDGWYRAGGMHAIAVEYMPICRVIRWGDGK